MKKNIVSRCIPFGVIMGVGFILYTLFMWLTKLDAVYLSIGQYFDMAIAFLPMIIIIISINNENKFQPVTFINRILIAITVGFVSFLIYDPFLYLYHHYINPSWFNWVVELKQKEFSAQNISPLKINETIETMKNSKVAQAGLFQLSSFIASVLILPTLIGLISFLFVKRSKNK